MAKSLENSNLDIPVEIPGEMSDGTKERSTLTLTEIEAELARRKKSDVLENAPAKSTNLVDPLEIKPIDKEPEPTETIDPRFVGKTEAEVIEMYKNLETLHSSHTNELGELRKAVKDFQTKEQQASELNLGEIQKKIMPEVESWNAEKRATWFEKFNQEPEKAMADVIKEIMKPYTKRQAVSVNQEEIQRLTELHKEHVVPFDLKEVNALIAANTNWWKTYGTGTFEHAYGVIANRDFDKYATARLEKIQAKVVITDPVPVKNKNTFVEGRTPQKVIGKVNEQTKADRDAAGIEAGLEAIEKELLKRGVPINI